MSPRPRGVGDDPVSHEWSRWDTPGRTIYGGSTAVGALVEVLEYITPAPPQIALTDLFDDVEPDDAITLDAQIASELPAHGAMPYRSISAGWRQSRRVYELQFPPTGWFVDVAGANSISSMGRELSSLLEVCELNRLTLSELTSSSNEMKVLTTGIATWLRDSIVLDDGSRPHGVVYPSKWGATHVNWAMWMRRTDDETGADPVQVMETVDIGRHIRPLIDAANLCRLTIF